jgi:signal transduction histidine kinase
MKTKWWHLVRDAAPWLFLLLLGDAFFIFLAWLASPATFPTLVGLMLAFTLGSAALGLWITARKKHKQEAAFQQFLAEPNLSHEADLIEASPQAIKGQIRQLGAALRDQQSRQEDYAHQAVDFEEFIEAWVHEIKTPLSLATLLLVNRREEMSEQVYTKLEHARREISEEVDRILYYARSHSDHIDYRFEPIPLSTCCTEALEDLASLFDEHGAVIHQNIEDIEVISDIKTLQFIITQIILNSVKYVRGEAPPVIHLSSGRDEDRQRHYLRIADEGIGVPKGDLPFIFDKGFTGKHPEHRKATGMGLYLVRKFCDDLGIEIEVDSQLGQGLTISLYFPIVKQI